MGCNYYVNIVEKQVMCPHCNKLVTEGLKEIHIGKSSVGWKFTFKSNPEYYEGNMESVVNWLKDKQIVDEYEKEISLGGFINLVMVKQALQGQDRFINAEVLDFVSGEFC